MFYTDFPGSLVGKESACNAGDPGSVPGSGRSSGEGVGYPLQYSYASLWLSWYRICPQCGRPGFYPWVGKISWRREWLPPPRFWPGEFHGLGASVVVACGLSSCGWWALELGLNSCAQAQLLSVMWDPPVPGIKPMSLTLADGFLITGPR